MLILCDFHQSTRITIVTPQVSEPCDCFGGVDLEVSEEHQEQTAMGTMNRKELQWPVTYAAMHRYAFKSGWLGGGFKYFLFSPRKLGKIPILTNIFQMGWNHQPDDNFIGCNFLKGILHPPGEVVGTHNDETMSCDGEIPQFGAGETTANSAFIASVARITWMTTTFSSD